MIPDDAPQAAKGLPAPSRLTDPWPVPKAGGPPMVTVRPPGSKSITNRLLVLSALAEGRSTLHGALRSDDTDRLAAALAELGAGIELDGTTVRVQGVGGRFPLGGHVDLGDGGTPTRFMLAAACRCDRDVVIDGSPRMRERPISDGVELLRSLGAVIDYVEAQGRLPVRVRGGARMRGGHLPIGATASSQFVSALMLIAPLLPEGLELEHLVPPTSASYLALTRATLRQFGVQAGDSRWAASPLAARRDRIEPARLLGRETTVEPDASSAVYWMVAAALLPGARIAVEGIAAGSAQPDIGMLEVLERFGAAWSSRRERPQTIVDGAASLSGIRMSLAHMPDGAMAAAMLAARAEGPSILDGLHTLRVKECDRLAGLVTELHRLGCGAEIRGDALIVDPETHRDNGPAATIETYRDHRMAMAFAVLGLARGGISIRDPACVAKSYPRFWEDLAIIAGAA